MAERTTNAMLDRLILRMNELTGSPTEYSTKYNPDPRPWLGLEINPGHYHVSKAYGAYKLERTLNIGGGTEDVFGHGQRYSKKELAGLILAFIAGYVEAGEGNQDAK